MNFADIRRISQQIFTTYGKKKAHFLFFVHNTADFLMANDDLIKKFFVRNIDTILHNICFRIHCKCIKKNIDLDNHESKEQSYLEHTNSEKNQEKFDLDKKIYYPFGDFFIEDTSVESENFRYYQHSRPFLRKQGTSRLVTAEKKTTSFLRALEQNPEIFAHKNYIPDPAALGKILGPPFNINRANCIGYEDFKQDFDNFFALEANTVQCTDLIAFNILKKLTYIIKESNNEFGKIFSNYLSYISKMIKILDPHCNKFEKMSCFYLQILARFSKEDYYFDSSFIIKIINLSYFEIYRRFLSEVILKNPRSLLYLKKKKIFIRKIVIAIEQEKRYTMFDVLKSLVEAHQEFFSRKENNEGWIFKELIQNGAKFFKIFFNINDFINLEKCYKFLKSIVPYIVNPNLESNCIKPFMDGFISLFYEIFQNNHFLSRFEQKNTSSINEYSERNILIEHENELTLDKILYKEQKVDFNSTNISMHDLMRGIFNNIEYSFSYEFLNTSDYELKISQYQKFRKKLVLLVEIYCFSENIDLKEIKFLISDKITGIKLLKNFLNLILDNIFEYILKNIYSSTINHSNPIQEDLFSEKKINTAKAHSLSQNVSTCKLISSNHITATSSNRDLFSEDFFQSKSMISSVEFLDAKRSNSSLKNNSIKITTEDPDKIQNPKNSNYFHYKEDANALKKNSPQEEQFEAAIFHQDQKISSKNNSKDNENNSQSNASDFKQINEEIRDPNQIGTHNTHSLTSYGRKQTVSNSTHNILHEKESPVYFLKDNETYENTIFNLKKCVNGSNSCLELFEKSVFTKEKSNLLNDAFNSTSIKQTISLKTFNKNQNDSDYFDIDENNSRTENSSKKVSSIENLSDVENPLIKDPSKIDFQNYKDNILNTGKEKDMGDSKSKKSSTNLDFFDKKCISFRKHIEHDSAEANSFKEKNISYSDFLFESNPSTSIGTKHSVTNIDGNSYESSEYHDRIPSSHVLQSNYYTPKSLSHKTCVKCSNILSLKDTKKISLDFFKKQKSLMKKTNFSKIIGSDNRITENKNTDIYKVLLNIIYESQSDGYRNEFVLVDYNLCCMVNKLKKQLLYYLNLSNPKDICSIIDFHSSIEEEQSYPLMLLDNTCEENHTIEKSESSVFDKQKESKQDYECISYKDIKRSDSIFLFNDTNQFEKHIFEFQKNGDEQINTSSDIHTDHVDGSCSLTNGCKNKESHKSFNALLALFFENLIPKFSDQRLTSCSILLTSNKSIFDLKRYYTLKILHSFLISNSKIFDLLHRKYNCIISLGEYFFSCDKSNYIHVQFVKIVKTLFKILLPCYKFTQIFLENLLLGLIFVGQKFISSEPSTKNPNNFDILGHCVVIYQEIKEFRNSVIIRSLTEKNSKALFDAINIFWETPKFLEVVRIYEDELERRKQSIERDLYEFFDTKIDESHIRFVFYRFLQEWPVSKSDIDQHL